MKYFGFIIIFALLISCKRHGELADIHIGDTRESVFKAMDKHGYELQFGVDSLRKDLATYGENATLWDENFNYLYVNFNSKDKVDNFYVIKFGDDLSKDKILTIKTDLENRFGKYEDKGLGVWKFGEASKGDWAMMIFRYAQEEPSVSIMVFPAND